MIRFKQEDIEIFITQDEFISLMKKEGGIYDQCINLIRVVKDKSNVEHITHVGMIGGSPLAAGLKEMIQECFPRLHQPPSINDRVTAVAMGAAIYCELFIKKKSIPD